VFKFERKETVDKMNFPLKKVGKLGRPVKVLTNCFSFSQFPTNSLIFHYDLTLSKDGTTFAEKSPSDFLCRAFSAFESQYKKELGNALPVYDLQRNVYTALRLPFGEQHTFQVQLPNECRPCFLLVKLVNVIQLGEMLDYLQGNGKWTANCQTAIQALDVLLRYKPSLTAPVIGKSFFSTSSSYTLPGFTFAYVAKCLYLTLSW
jgi:eukaryotic translation initiation factor 2C